MFCSKELMDTDVGKNENELNVERDVTEITESTSKEDRLDLAADGDVCQRSGQPQGYGVDKV